MIKIVEVGPRDGLQNEKEILDTQTKLNLIQKLVDAGIPQIEITSFVSPKWIPQMADQSELARQVLQAPWHKHSPKNYLALVPNEKGYDNARAAGIQAIAVFTAASETFSQKNTNCSIQESFDRFKNIIKRAKVDNIWVRGYVSCVLGCPYEGVIKPEAVLSVCEQLFALGCDEISLGDTIGVGTPSKAKKLINLIKSTLPIEKLAVHFHDTYGQALANIYACLDAGIRIIDSSVSGLGGCPYAKGASGNVATEDVVYMLHGMGLTTGIDLNKLIEAGQYICQQLGITTRSKVNQALFSNP